jgi:hypothetical protein
MDGLMIFGLAMILLAFLFVTIMWSKLKKMERQSGGPRRSGRLRVIYDGAGDAGAAGGGHSGLCGGDGGGGEMAAANHLRSATRIGSQRAGCKQPNRFVLRWA